MKTKHAKTRPPRWLGSVQQTFVRLQGVSGDVLCVGAPGRPAAYVGVLEVGGISYDLKSQREQERLMDLWQQILAGITFPVQLLWRSLPLRLDPYLHRFERPVGVGSDQTSVWETLAAAHVQHVRALAAHRTLVERRIYLLVRVNAGMDASAGLKRLFWPGPPRPQAAEALEQARAELEIRLSELARHLQLLQLSTRRLSGLVELGSFYQSCLTPITAAQFPLAADTLEGVEAAPAVRRASVASVAPVVRVCPACQRELPDWASFCGDCGAALAAPRLVAEPPPGTAEPPPASHTVEAAPAAQPSSSRWARWCGRRRRPSEPAPARQTLFPQLADLLAPSAIEVQPDYLKVGDEWQQLLVVTGLPRVVEAGWLRPLLSLDEPFELSFHLRPEDPVRMEDLLRRKRTQFQATKLLALGKGQLVDPHIEIAQGDIEDLMTKVASGTERLFDLAWVIRVWGASRKDVTDRVRRLQHVLHLLRLSWRVATYEQGPALRSCLPQVRPQLDGEGLLLPSETLSTAFPFVASSLFHDEGVLVGVTPSKELVVLNPWARTRGVANANMVVFGPPGQGKSTLVKTLVERLALGYQLRCPPGELGFQLFVIDPESEYGLLAAALGGQQVRLSPGSPDKINPFDLPQPRTDRLGSASGVDVLAVQMADLHRLLSILLAAPRADGSPGTLTQDEDSLLDLALLATYDQAGITRDPRTHTRPAPLMSDFACVLRDHQWPISPASLLTRLERFTTGSGSSLFSGSTTLNVHSPVVVFDTSACQAGMQQIIAQFLISTFVWGQAFGSRIPRFLVVDEAATWMRYTGGKRALEEYTERARKHFLSVINITQEPETFVGSKLIANSAIKWLLRPDPSSLPLVRSLFDLSEREAQRLLRLQVGEALLMVADQRGSQRLIVKNEISALELVLAQTDPSVLAEWVSTPEYAPLRQLLRGLAAGGLGTLAAYLDEEASA